MIKLMLLGDRNAVLRKINALLPIIFLSVIALVIIASAIDNNTSTNLTNNLNIANISNVENSSATNYNFSIGINESINQLNVADVILNVSQNNSIINNNSNNENNSSSNSNFVSRIADFVVQSIDYVTQGISSLIAGSARFSNAYNITGLPNNYTYLRINPVTPYDSQIGYWSFDADTATTAYDLSGNNNDGTYTNSPYSSSSCGVYGNGLCVDGTNGRYVNAGSYPSLRDLQGNYTLSLWFKIAGSGSDAIPDIIRNGRTDGYGKECASYILEATSSTQLTFGGGNSTVNCLGPTNFITYPVSQNQWYFVTVGINQSNYWVMYLNGVLVNSTLKTINQTTSSAQLSIGGMANTAHIFNGSIDDVMIFNSSLTAQQITDIYNNQSARHYNTGVYYSPQITSSQTVSNTINLSFNDFQTNQGTAINVSLGTWDISQGYNDSASADPNNPNYGLVGYWHGDNVTGNANVVAGKVGNALSFDGVDDYVVAPFAQSLNSSNTNQLTVSTWVKRRGPLGASFNVVGLVDRYFGVGSGSWDLYVGSGPPFTTYFYVANTSGFWGGPSIPTLDTNWNYIVGTYDGTKVSIYLNGILNNSINVTGGIFSTLSQLAIGRDANPYYFNGSIDQVRVWNRSLSAIEISNLYNNESAGLNDPNMNRTGLVGEWNMNESNTSLWASNTPDTSGNGNHGQEINMLGANVADSSGNGNNGNATGGTTLLNGGKYNQSFSFNGVNGYVQTANSALTNGNTQITYSLWMYPTSFTGYTGILESRGTRLNGLAFDSVLNSLDVWINNSFVTASNTGVSLNNWAFITATWNGSYASVYVNGLLKGSGTLNTGALAVNSPYIIGQDTLGGRWFNGSIDEVMIYNRSLSAQEVQDLYVRGRANWNYTAEQNLTDYNTKARYNYSASSGIVSCWLDGVNDSCGGGNNGVLVGGANWTNINRGGVGNLTLGLNGSNYVNLSATSVKSLSTGTIGAWVKPNTISSLYTVISLTDGTSSYDDYTIFLYPTYIRVYCKEANVVTLDATATGLNPDAWNYISYFVNSSGNYFYINGQKITPTYATGSASTTDFFSKITQAANLRIGYNYCQDDPTYSYPFKGYIDEVAIWNRSLSAAEIQDIYLNTKQYRSMNTFTNVSRVVTNILPVTKLISNVNNSYTPYLLGSGNVNYYLVDYVFPGIVFNSNTDLNGANLTRNNIIVNVTGTDDSNVSSLNIYLYNSTSLVNNTNASIGGISGIFYLNLSGLNDGIYYLNASVFDGTNLNWTETRNIIVDSHAPGGNLTIPLNGTLVTYNPNQNFVVNFTDNVGLQNATLNIINSSGNTINQTTTNFGLGVVTGVVGTVVTLVDGAYTWFYDLFDWGGNRYLTLNYSLIMDTHEPNTTSEAFSSTVNYQHLINSINSPYDSLVGYWSFDQDNSTTAFDLTGNNNDGAYTNSPYTSSSCGVYGNGLCLNGVNQYVSIPDSSSLNLNGLSGSTVTLWVKTTNGKDATLIDKQSYGNHIAQNTGNYAGTIVLNNTAIGCTPNLPIGANNTWQFVAMTYSYNATNGTISIYKNGTLGGTCLTQALPLYTVGGIYRIGADGFGSYFNGSIDDVMIFNSSLTAAQITAIYNNQSARFYKTGQSYLPQFNVTSGYNNVQLLLDDFARDQNTNLTESIGAWDISRGYNESASADPNNINYGLVGYWHGDNVTGNANVVPGKVGNALQFDGVDDYVSVPHSTILNVGQPELTAMAWIYPKSAGGGNQLDYTVAGGDGIVSKYQGSVGGYHLFLAQNNLSAFLYNGSAYEKTAGGNIQDNRWYHVVMTRNQTALTIYVNGTRAGTVAISGNVAQSTFQFAIGEDTYSAVQYSPFNGTIDQVRVWNRSLSATEIANIYGNESINITDPNMNRTGLVGEWNMNESATSLWASTTLDTSGNGNNGQEINMLGANVLDSSGNGNNGNATGGTTLLYRGKYNQSFNFNGVNGYVIAPDISSKLASQISYGAWVKTSSKSAMDIINSQNLVTKFDLKIQTGGAFIDCNVYNATTVGNGGTNSFIATDGNWHFLMCTYDGTRNSFYADGILRSSSTALSGPIKSGAESVWIGQRQAGTFWNGSMDEVMIYNRSLSAQEVQDLYVRGRANWNYSTEQNLTDYNTQARYNYSTSSGIVSCWLDGASDSCGGGNNGVLVGGANWSNSNRGGVGNLTLGLNGSSQYVSLPNGTTNLNNVTGAITYSSWIYLNSVSSTYVILANRYANVPNETDFDVRDTGKLFLSLQNGSGTGYYETSNQVIYPGKWYHVVVTLDGQTFVNFYVNGVLVAASNSPPQRVQPMTKSYYIGAFSAGGAPTSPWNGYIDDVAIWNRSLSASEIQDIYLNTKQNRGNNTFAVSTATTNVLPKFGLQSDSNGFYTPWVKSTSLTALQGVDTQVPVVTLLNSVDGAAVNSGVLNASFTDNVGLSTVTLNLWYANGTIVNQTTVSISGISNSTGVNVTLPALGVYIWNYYACDFSNNCAYAGTNSSFIYDVNAPNGNLTLPLNGTNAFYNPNQNFVVNFTDNYGLKNATLNIINATGNTINQTTTNFGFGVVTGVVGTVVTLVDGAYTWFYDLFDWSGNRYFTLNYSLIMDTHEPNTTSEVFSSTSIYQHLINSIGDPYSNLVGYWSFDADNSTTAYDLSGNNNDGSYVSGGYSSLSDGVYGNGLHSNGVCEDISVTATTSLNAINSSFTLSTWMLMKGNALVSQYPVYIGKGIGGTGANQGYWLQGTSGTSQVSYAWGYGGVGNTTSVGTVTLALNRWYYLTATYNWNGTNSISNLYVNGILNNTNVANYIISQSTAQNLHIGNGRWNTGSTCGFAAFNGSIDDVMIFNSSLTQAQITAIYNNQSQRFYKTGQSYLPQSNVTSGYNNVQLLLDDFARDQSTNITESVGAWDISKGYNDTTSTDPNNPNYGLVGYWHGDNVTGNANVVAGKVGNALKFDGVDDYVETAYSPIGALSNFTISFWENATDITSGRNFFTEDQASGGGWGLHTSYTSGSKIIYEWVNTSGLQYTGTSSGTFPINTWNHITLTRDTGTNQYTLYKNGVYDSNITMYGPIRNMIRFRIGDWWGGGSLYKGTLDNFRVWNRALSATEIANLYNNESTGIVDPNMNRTGLVGEWLFNESATSLWASTTPDTSGNGNNGAEINMIGANVLDSSGNGNTGNASGATTLLYGGKYNNSFTFKGTAGSYVSIPGAPISAVTNTSITVAGWVYENSLSSGVYTTFVAQDGTARRWFVGHNGAATSIGCYVFNATTTATANSATLPTYVGRWAFFTCTYDGSTIKVYSDGILSGSTAFTGMIRSGNDNLIIGTDGGAAASFTRLVNGSIDEVMIYNRSLSAQEVQDLYYRGRANWNYTNEQVVNENNKTYNYSASSGIVSCWLDGVSDSCGGGNNGTYVGTASWNVTNRGTIGNNTYTYAPNQYVKVLDSSSLRLVDKGTISAWIKKTNGADLRYNIVGKGLDYNSGTNAAYGLYITNGNAIGLQITNGVTFNQNINYGAPTDSNWHHIVGTWNGTAISTYMDGVLRGAPVAQTINCSQTAWNITIGDGMNTNVPNYGEGLDEVAIWNRSLSASEIQQIYLNTKQNRGNNTFAVSTATTNVLPKFGLQSDSNGFYTPWVKSTSFTSLQSLDTQLPISTIINVSGNGNGFITNVANQIFSCNASDNLGLSSITLYIYNSTGIVNNSVVNSVSGVFNSTSLNYTFVRDNNYLWNCLATDSSGNGGFASSNYTIVYDSTLPNGTLISPGNGTYWNSNQNFTANLSDNVAGLKNATLNIVNSSGNIVNQTTLTFGAGVVNNVVGVVVSLVDGVYSWFYNLFDLAGNQFNTTNNTAIIDTIVPGVKIDIGGDLDGSFVNRSYILANISYSDINPGNITLFVYNISGSVNSSLQTGVTLNAWFNMAGLRDGVYWYNASAMDYAGNVNITGTRNVTVDTTKPLISYTNPTQNSGVYLNRNYIEINTSATDTNLANVTFSLYNLTSIFNSTLFVSSPFYVNYVSLAEGIYFYNATVIDYASNLNNTITRNITLDRTNPLISYGSGTLSDYTNVSQNLIYVNVSVSEINFANITYSLYNLTGIVNSTVYGSVVNSINWVNLPDNHYSYNVTIYDLAGNVNYTQIRRITLDVNAPNGTLLSPQNGTYLNYTNVNLTANVSDSLSGINNATLNIYNQTGLYNQTTILLNGALQSTIGIVVNLVDGVYSWFYNLFDFAGNQFNTVNNTVITDTTNPTINFSYPTPAEGSFNLNNNVSINVTGIELNRDSTIVYLDGIGYYMGCSEIPNYECNYTFFGLLDGWYNVSVLVNDSAGNYNNTETRAFAVDTTSPTISSVWYYPNSNDSVDPGTNISFYANLSDDLSGVSNVYLEVYNGTDWKNISMARVDGDANDGSYEGNITTVLSEENYTFNVWANDNVGNVNLTVNQTFKSYWDCTWNVITAEAGNSLGTTGGFFETRSLGNVTIVNSGDREYAINNCSIRFAKTISGGSWSSYANFSVDYVTGDFPGGVYGLIYYANGIEVGDLTLTAHTNQTLEIKGIFPRSASVYSEYPFFPVFSSIADSLDGRTNETIFAKMIVTPGAYLEVGIDSNVNQYISKIESFRSSNTIYLTPGNVTFNASIKDVVDASVNINNTAYNVYHEITFDNLTSGLIVGETNASYSELNDTSKKYVSATMQLTASNIVNLGTETLNVNTGGYGYENSTGNLSLIKFLGNSTVTSATGTFTFACYPFSDGICVNSCINLTTNLKYDPDCDLPGNNIVVNGNNGNSGGGGGGGGGAEFKKSELLFQIIRGKQNEIKIPFKNANPNLTLTGVKFDLSGRIARYIEVVPKEMDAIAPSGEVDVLLKISSPSYLPLGKESLVLTIKGKLGEQEYTEQKNIVLEIVELNRSDALALLDKSIELIKQLKDAGLKKDKAEQLLNDSQAAYNALNFGKISDNYNIISKEVSDGLNANKILKELDSLLVVAKEKGINTANTERLVKLAKLSMDREEYDQAYSRAKEAQVSYALEVKGEFGKLSYYIKENPVPISLGILFITLFSFASYKIGRFEYLKNKVAKLKEEEAILNQLIKVIQTDTFITKKMGMEEYQQALSQYEKKMATVIEELIDITSLKTHTLRLTSNENRLKIEKRDLIEMIKQLQKEYLTDGKIEAKVYELKLQSYMRRLGEIDQETATREAQREMNKKGRWSTLINFIKESRMENK